MIALVRVDIGNIPSEYDNGVTFNALGSVRIDKQKTGFGYKRFFICPHCYHRVQHIYLGDAIRCRHCKNRRTYKSITDAYRGGEVYIRYKMERIAAKYGLIIKYPFDYRFYEKPKYTHSSTWDRVLRRLQTLENMRFSVIMFGGTVSTKVIKYYLNEGLYTFSVEELRKCIISWGYPATLIRSYACINKLIEKLK